VGGAGLRSILGGSGAWIVLARESLSGTRRLSATRNLPSIVGIFFSCGFDSVDRTLSVRPLVVTVSRKLHRPACLVIVTTDHTPVCVLPARGVLEPAVASSLLFSVPAVHNGSSSPVPRGYPRILKEPHRYVSHHLFLLLTPRAAAACSGCLAGLPG